MNKGVNMIYLEEKIAEKRNQLHNLLEYGEKEEIIKFSQELDILINEYNRDAIERNSC